jgi:pyridoxine 5'-phosphate synthase PdxJ
MAMSKEVEQVKEVEQSGVGVYVFKHPTKIEGDDVKEISYDFTEINGKAIRQAKSELQKRSYTVAVKELDECFHAALFAQASGLTLDSVEILHAVDYMNVADLARDFLMGEG